MNRDGQTIRVLHSASHVINVGDGALNSVIQDRLRKLAQRPIEFTLIDSVVSPPELRASDVDQFDLVVVGGGGTIYNGPRTTRNGIELNMSLDDYRRCRTPFVFVALGHNLFNGVAYRNGPALARLIDAAAERGDPFSVRNDGSLARLRRDVGDAKTVVEVPDPGFFVGSPAIRPQEASERPYMLLQVAADGLGLRLGANRARRALWRVWPLGAAALADSLADFTFGI